MLQAQYTLYTVSGKETKMFFVIYSTKLGRLRINLVHSSWINLLQNHVNVFYLTWIMSLHYLVKLQMLTALPMRCSESNYKIYPISTVALNQVDYSAWEYCHGRCTKRMMTWSSSAHSFLSCCFSSSRSVMLILNTFFCNISHTLYSTVFKSVEFRSS